MSWLKRVLVLLCLPVLIAGLAACKQQMQTRENADEMAAVEMPALPEEAKIPEKFGWEKLSGDERTTNYVDTLNVEKESDGRTQVWSRVEHHALLNIGPMRNIKYELHRMTLNCREKTTEMNLWVALDTDEKEIARQFMKVQGNAPGPGNQKPEADGETIATQVYEHMCHTR